MHAWCFHPSLVGLLGPAGKGMKIGPPTHCAGTHPVTRCYWSRITEAGSWTHSQPLYLSKHYYTTHAYSLMLFIPPSPPTLSVTVSSSLSLTNTHPRSFTLGPSVWAWEYGHFSLSGTCFRKNTNGKVCWFQQDRDLNIIPAWHCYCESLFTLLDKVIHKNVIIISLGSGSWC